MVVLSFSKIAQQLAYSRNQENMSVQNLVAIVVGTRPEVIKMVPVYQALKAMQIPTLLISTGQHTSLVRGLFELFDLRPDYDLAIGKQEQDLCSITQAVLGACEKLFADLKPAMVLVQGDTTSAMAAALGAFYQNIIIGHVEAGLRTGDIRNPFPEEMNRQFIGIVARYHYAPTTTAYKNLLAQGIDSARIIKTGNTVIDSLFLMRKKIEQGVVVPGSAVQQFVARSRAANKKIMILTTHRRESFGGGGCSEFFPL